MRISKICVFGGAHVQTQIGAIKRGADIVVATPGRLIDILCLNKGKLLSLDRITYVVLDEADRMFDMGFEKQIEHVLNNIRPDRQTVMFSATFPAIVQRAARQYLHRPLEITVRGGSFVPETIDQKIVVFDRADQKFSKLMDVINEFYQQGSIIIFVETQNTVDKMFTKLIKSGYDAISYHAGLDQADRHSAISDFKQGIKNILISTSLGARGLDVPHTKVVINYEAPNHLEDYVHRVGRTGRAGESGTAYTFISQEEEAYSEILIKVLQKCNLPIPDDLQAMFDIFKVKCKTGTAKVKVRKFKKGRGYLFDEDEEKAHLEEKMSYRAPYLDSEPQEKEPSEMDYDGYDTLENNTGAPKEDAGTLARRFIEEELNGLLPMSKQRFSDKLDINDYPQDARFSTIKADTLQEVSEMTGCSIVVKGEFVGIGKYKPGVERLHLLIDGPSRTAVDSARIELKRIIDEKAVLSKPDGPATRRYNVV
eukprot:TRINITY_DN4661_c0_g1_i2.p1 TRINITY_DN4661_c0_g1~~TRINITY_DN4661_c0_g1_i2.p1  ORF type:complete len:481 (-),score=105.36 TRINITY_DN4661_c0_g1_i2:23-1465(-)